MDGLGVVVFSRRRDGVRVVFSSRDVVLCADSGSRDSSLFRSRDLIYLDAIYSAF